jgi:NTP pyrophosphatase (non-canonical NTP hydrolase)
MPETNITTLNGYQKEAKETAIFWDSIRQMTKPLHEAARCYLNRPDMSNSAVAVENFMALSYVSLGLSNEAGEFAGKVKKMLRGDDIKSSLLFDCEQREKLAHELGDVLWYLANCADTIGFSLEMIAQMNLAKLRDRKERGVLKGNGDNR